MDRIGVQDADPVEAVETVELAEKLRQPDTSIKVETVVRGVLGHEDELADAVVYQLAGFAHDFFDRLGDVFPAHAGDGAERTKAVAAFGNLQVGVVPGGNPQAG